MLQITNCKVSDLAESIVASGYPMSTYYDEKKQKQRLSELQDFIDNPQIMYKRTWCDEQIRRAVTLGQAKPGSGHDCFLKGIKVSFDMKYPLYLSRQMQRYNWFDFVSSSSTMHKVHVTPLKENCNKYVDKEVINVVQKWIDIYNNFTEEDNALSKYEVYMHIISNLPQGYELVARMTTNYMQLKTMYDQRKNHKLKEDWGYFCNWCEGLPLFKEFCIKN